MKQQSGILGDDTDCRPIAPRVRRVLPRTISGRQSRDRDPFDRTCVDVGDSITSGASDDLGHSIATVVDGIFRDGRQRHRPRVIKDRCVIHRRDIDDNTSVG